METGVCVDHVLFRITFIVSRKHKARPRTSNWHFRVDLASSTMPTQATVFKSSSSLSLKCWPLEVNVEYGNELSGLETI